MPRYAAFLGNQPRLSIAELGACVPDCRVLRVVERTVAIIETPAELAQVDLDRWGGTMLLARSMHDTPSSVADVPAMLVEQTGGSKGKVTFALRGIGIDSRAVRDLYRTCKDALKKAGRPSRYVGNERIPAATALLHDAGLVDGSEGCEVVMVSEKDFLFIGRTVAAQNPDAYTKRDMEKPVRDTRAGLLPPKLAQMMLNYALFLLPDAARKKGALTVLDPFCGTGVIPIETLLRGWHVLASDKSEKAVSGCQKNVEWTRKEYKVKKTEVKSQVWKQDATKPFVLKEKPDVVVSETMLGPALSARPTVKDAQSMRAEADKLEMAFLENAAATLPGVPLVLTFPIWYQRTGPQRLERVWQAITDAGYEAVLPPGVEKEDERASLVYRRGDQFVGREIVLLRPR